MLGMSSRIENWVWKVYTRWRKQRGVGELLRLVKQTVRVQEFK